MESTRGAYDELYVYAMGRDGFVLQHVVDAFAAQCADENSKPIGVIFALAGLLLRVEKLYSGRQVQEVHRKLAAQSKRWPGIKLPEDRGAITAVDVMAVAAGPQRDAAIDRWCEAVWAAYRSSHPLISDLLQAHGVL